MDGVERRMDELLTKVYRSISKVEEQMLYELSEGRLTLGEMHLLESIGKRRGSDVSVTDIAQDLEITLPSVTTMAKRLQRKGYLTRDRSRVDARKVQLVLTSAGRRAEIAHRYFHRKMIRELTAEFSAAEKAAILTGLEKMHAFMRQQIADNAGKEE